MATARAFLIAANELEAGGFKSMNENTVQPGKYVAVSYTIYDENGQLLEDCEQPVGFVYGSATELLDGIDAAIRGRQQGDVFEVALPPGQGFGMRDPALLFTDRLDNVPEDYRHVGAEVEMTNESGETRTFYVSRIEDGNVTIDGNHPLAGRSLVVRVRITEVRDARIEDMRDESADEGAMPPSRRLH